ncbi:MAG TPA: serine/threonine-protein kinase [Kofleriaceae bacterium]
MDDELRCGEHIGNYILGDVLGVGGMGIVYSAVQRSLGRAVAVKMPRSDVSAPELAERRFRNEARVASRLWHRNVVSVIDYGNCNELPYLAMERVHGRLLGRIVRTSGALNPALATELVAQVLDALAAAHAVGIVHADVKPDNVFIEQQREPFARVFDFGVARFDDHEDTEPGLLYGTPDYIAPELIRGHRPSVCSDIYAAGAMLYELLTARTPFGGGQSHEVLARHLQMEVIPPSRARGDGWIAAELDDLVLRALDKRPGARFPDAKTFAEQLRAVTRTTGESARPQVQHIEKLRAEAMRRCDETNAAYLELARALLDEDQPARAAAELEQAVGLLCQWTNAGTPPRSIWCVYITLAALYAHLGDLSRARRLAHVAYHQALGARSQVGEQRAQALLARLAANALDSSQSVEIQLVPDGSSS